MQRVAVINVVGLSPSLLGPSTPRLTAFARKARHAGLPAGLSRGHLHRAGDLSSPAPRPREHGIVGNGWYYRELRRGPLLEADATTSSAATRSGTHLRREHPGFTCAKLFWWYNMYSSADLAITPRPIYPADGRKVFDIHTQPMDLREQVEARPRRRSRSRPSGARRAGIAVRSRMDRRVRQVDRGTPIARPSASIYLPHLDYNLQKLGPGAPGDRARSWRRSTPSPAS